MERFAELCLCAMVSPDGNFRPTVDDARDVLAAVAEIPPDLFGPAVLTQYVANRFVDAVFSGDFSLVPAEIRSYN
jgi:hypothetical protein